MNTKDLKFGSKAPKDITPQDCLPAGSQYCKKVETWDELTALGFANLQDCIRRWRLEERQLYNHQIKPAKSVRDFFAKFRTKEEILRYAGRFSGLKEGYGSRYSELTMTPVPTDEDALKREPGSSTLNVCGWCKFCRTGIRHGISKCSLNGACDLMPERHDADGQPMNFCRFDRKCAFIELLETQPWTIEYYQGSNQRRLSQLMEENAKLSKRKTQLHHAQMLAGDYPAFPHCRRLDYCKPGDRVRVLLVRKEDLFFASDGTMRAPVRSGKVIPNDAISLAEKLSSDADVRSAGATFATDLMMNTNGFVKVRLDAPPDDKSAVWDMCVTHGFIMLEKDFRQLMKEREYRKLWLKSVDDPRLPWLFDTWRDVLGIYDELLPLT